MLAPVPGRHVSERLRDMFSGTTPCSAVAVVFALVGVAFLGSVLLSPGGWQWWLDAKAVHGTERDGIVFYSYGGTSYTVDDVGSSRNGPRTVYVIPSEPSNAALEEAPTQFLDWGMTAVPLVLAAGLVVVGLAKKRTADRERRRQAPGAFGAGLGRGTLDRLLEEQRRPPAPGASTGRQTP
jgi:hypothetical protein